jgi:hypothetical protein
MNTKPRAAFDGMAPSDFFFLGRVNRQMPDHNSWSRENLLNKTTGIVGRIDKELLIDVFEFWTKRTRWVRKHFLPEEPMLSL